MSAFTLLVELVVGIVCLNVVFIIARAPAGQRWRLIAVQLGVIGLGTGLAMMLPFRSLVEYYWQVWAVLIMLGFSLALTAAIVFRWLWRDPSAIRRLASRMILALLASALLVVGLEGIFKLAVAQSDAFLLTYSARNWVRRHWSPINSLGYRDREPDPTHRPRLLVVGDSFAAGFGVEDVEQRFVNRLRQQLEPPFRVDLVADVGWSTADEIEAVAGYPVVPDAVVLSYFLNDITSAAEGRGQTPPNVARSPTGPLGHAVQYSFFANFVYWRTYRLGLGTVGANYWDFVRSCFADPGIWAEHSAELDRLLATAPDHCRWLVVVFPQLRDVEGSLVMTDKVVGHFESRGVPVLDLAHHLRGRDWRELVVNHQDGHPSPALHEEVAGLIHDQLRVLWANPVQTRSQPEPR